MTNRFQQARTEELDKETDAFVWGVVRYLDSSSDYREYLPYPHQATSLRECDLALLDDIPRHVRAWLRSLTVFATVFCVNLLAVLRS